VEREPQPVEPKLLLPLVQAAALETDEILSEKWAALLANAADPAQRIVVHPSYTEVLRQLTSIDARVLAALYASTSKPPESASTDGFYTKTLPGSFGLTYEETSFTVDNLLRLQLCRAVHVGRSGLMPVTIVGNAFVYYFLAALTPPTP
jgi:hypothetical protein